MTRKHRSPTMEVPVLSGLTERVCLTADERHALQLVGLLLARGTLLPELLAYFGSSRETLRFLERFAGSKMILPSRRELGQWARDINIWRRMSADPSRETTRRLALLYGLTERRVRAIYDDTAEAIPRIVHGKAAL